jgi:hypothetical protein
VRAGRRPEGADAAVRGRLANPDGAVVFEMKGLPVPHLSDTVEYEPQGL